MIKLIRRLPGVGYIVDKVLQGEVKGALKLLAGKDGNGKKSPLVPIPEKGVSPDRIINLMNALHSTENSAEQGKSFAYTYTTTTEMEAFSRCIGTAYEKFMESGNSDVPSHEKMLSGVLV
jgi:hypothetical protein